MNEMCGDLDNLIRLSKDPDTLGFDLSAGETWIYPTNYQVRDYQYNISQEALHKNTLVSLPTGLGKTFIAAVVMYNFYRWYPTGKIIFMAPTKPLVKQQQDACYNITAIPPSSTAEMTGTKIKTTRCQIWQEKRVFFITPQILQNDIDVVLNLAQQIKCIVIDEAHKALGKHANCEAIKKIHKINKNFRVLALSATPGSNFNSVRDVIINLLISHIEVRTNESIDVAPYVFKRKLDTFVIPITGQLLIIKNKFIKILDTYTRPLLQFNIITGNCANLTKGRIVLTMKDFKEKGRHHQNYSYILKNLNICVTLYHGYELLIRHGLRGFLVFFDGNISKPLLTSIHELREILNDIRNYLGPVDEIEMLPDGTIPDIEGPVVYSHPKFQKLSEIIIQHFQNISDDTRVMVFCEYRESVMEIYQMLLRQRPLIKPRIFLGQGAISQAKQLQAIKQFKSGICNTLISTCIGEEGLDVGEVDLIICFDISSKSPIRMVQRMGRTGRKRDGRVVVLVTEGKEQQLLSESVVQRNNMTSVLESQPIKQHLYPNNPKMIPDNIKPHCNKMYITVQETEKTKKKEKPEKKTKSVKNSNTLKNMFENISSQASIKNSEEDIKNNKIASPVKVSRSKKVAPVKNQMDLRCMFSKISNSQSTTISSQNHSEDLSENTNENSSELNTLITKIKSYLNETKDCYKLYNISKITTICGPANDKVTVKWTKPDVSIFKSITAESLQHFSDNLVNKNISINANNTTPSNIVKNSNNVTYESSDKSIFQNSLEFFNLESTFDVFSDSSEENYPFIEEPIIFNRSVGIFDSSKVYRADNLITPDKSSNKIFENLKENEKTNEDDDIVKDEDVSIISNSEDESPILNTQKFVNYKKNYIKKVSQSQNEKNVCSDVNIDNIEKSESNKIVKNINLLPVTTGQNVLSPVLNLSTSKNVNNELESDAKFWDESLFEICDSDDSLFSEEIDPLNKNVSTTAIVEELKNDLNEKQIEIENEEAKDESDTTIIYSFDTDKIFQEIEEQSKIENKNTHNTATNLKEMNQEQISELLKDFDNDSEEEFSLLNFSQNRKRKLQQSQKKSETFDEKSKKFNLENEKHEESVKLDLNKKKSEEDFVKSVLTQNECHTKKRKLQMTKTEKTNNENTTLTQVDSLKLSNKRIQNALILVSSDSDDDFETKSKIKPSKLITPNKKINRLRSQPSFSKPNEKSKKNNSRSLSYPTTSKTTNSKKKSACKYIDDEATVEKDENYVSDSDSEQNSDEQLLQCSFISNTPNILDKTDMHIKYLQSIRSPKFKPGAFKIPRNTPPQEYEDVFSQVENYENDTYMDNSFCVGNDQVLSQREEMSYLEVIEAQLENRRKKSKKRKRIINASDSE